MNRKPPQTVREHALSLIDTELKALTEARRLLMGGDPRPAPAAEAITNVTGGMSAEGRQRISQAQKKRWARVKRAARRAA